MHFDEEQFSSSTLITVFSTLQEGLSMERGEGRGQKKEGSLSMNRNAVQIQVQKDEDEIVHLNSDCQPKRSIV